MYVSMSEVYYVGFSIFRGFKHSRGVLEASDRGYGETTVNLLSSDYFLPIV